jgi:hypothetical protein
VLRASRKDSGVSHFDPIPTLLVIVENPGDGSLGQHGVRSINPRWEIEWIDPGGGVVTATEVDRAV